MMDTSDPHPVETTPATDSLDPEPPTACTFPETTHVVVDALCRQFDVELLVRRQEVAAIRAEIARTEYILDILQALLVNGNDRAGLAHIVANYESRHRSKQSQSPGEIPFLRVRAATRSYVPEDGQVSDNQHNTTESYFRDPIGDSSNSTQKDCISGNGLRQYINHQSVSLPRPSSKMIDDHYIKPRNKDARWTKAPNATPAPPRGSAARISGQHYLNAANVTNTTNVTNTANVEDTANVADTIQKPQIKVSNEAVDWEDFDAPAFVIQDPINIPSDATSLDTETSDESDDPDDTGTNDATTTSNQHQSKILHFKDEQGLMLNNIRPENDTSTAQDLKGSIKGSRFHVIREVIVGNTSEYVPPGDTQEKDSSHQFKWVVYLKAPNTTANGELGRLIRKVRFYLHPDYRPFDVVDVDYPPFELSRLGWGECPVRLQIYFWDPINKPINIIHMLNVELEINRLTKLKNIADVSVIPIAKEDSTPHSTAVADSKFEVTEFLDDIPTIEKSPVDIHPRERDEPLSSVNLFIKDKDSIVTSTSSPADDADTSDSDTTNDDSAPAEPVEIRLLTSEIAELIEAGCKRYPIIRKESVDESSYRYSTATDFKMFMSWSMGKRKSVEIQRARLVKQYIEMNSTVLVAVPTVIVWCRQLGHTPSSIRIYSRPVAAAPLEAGVSTKSTPGHYCSVCGVFDCSDCPFGHLVPFNSATRFEYIPTKPRHGKTLSGISAAVQSRLTQHVYESSDDSDRMLSSGAHTGVDMDVLEKQWIASVLHRMPHFNWWPLGTLTKAMLSAEAPLSVFLVNKAVRAFLKEILFGAVHEYQAQNSDRQLHPGLLVPSHVFQSILRNRRMAFLSNEGMMDNDIGDLGDNEVCSIDE
ncbi:hypothetical protein BASA50_004408 [Batrachochytrium salamandrivorans]|uniref:YEATS domain-containing protein n=1 Tax=Batrachochytrium salamandrivorans TaxID=1357716 RepID=A0ABQ8FIL7_9FUNG|nr:hypothetical protein BASA50_004408 [Batrachochytrium salamandrivorans]